MNRRLIVRSEAEADITKAALWYDKREKGLGWDFTIEVRSAIQRAMELPFSQIRLRIEPEVRRILTRRFPYRIFYIVRNDANFVFAVLHGARSNRRWTKRL